MLHKLPSAGFSHHLVLLDYTQLLKEKRDKAEVLPKAQILVDIVKENAKARNSEASKSHCSLTDNNN
jgi:hypothetical protein